MLIYTGLNDDEMFRATHFDTTAIVFAIQSALEDPEHPIQAVCLFVSSLTHEAY